MGTLSDKMREGKERVGDFCTCYCRALRRLQLKSRSKPLLCETKNTQQSLRIWVDFEPGSFSLTLQQSHQRAKQWEMVGGRPEPGSGTQWRTEENRARHACFYGIGFSTAGQCRMVLAAGISKGFVSPACFKKG